MMIIVGGVGKSQDVFGAFVEKPLRYNKTIEIINDVGEVAGIS